MKKEELTQLGLTEEQANAVFAMAGRDVEKFKKQVSDLEIERTDLQGRLTAANDAVAKFEGIDPEQLQSEVEKYKQQAIDAETNYQKQLTLRDQKSWIKGKMDEYGVESPYAAGGRGYGRGQRPELEGWRILRFRRLHESSQREGQQPLPDR